ncbi:sulfotransferase family protein [Pseudoruegeria sp. SHC-113]|uniref:sulfotransferase family protein n=1 Tax=Pseudoruegeria sp. SHC-113 TaxID=2855439 RepID=UPI0021BB64C8|nr:sulfotransferase family protein [Pseudoruegeria sp. SHC-113]MCT8159964.1 sulfotransferase family protein [Pseudoruegeria sp. SHC-113]
MLAFPEHALVLLAVPKTGTTALHNALEAHAQIRLVRTGTGKHMTFRRYSELLAPFMEAYSGGAPQRSVAVLREPVEWLNSWYRFRARLNPARNPASTAGISFNEFVADYLSENRPRHADLMPQAAYVVGKGDAPGVSHLFRYEALGLAADFLSEALGVTLDLERTNVSPRGDTALDPALKSSFMARHALDFELYEQAVAS